MIIEEFINTYAEQELTKLTKIHEQQQQMLEDEDDVESLDIAPAYRGGRKSLNIIIPYRQISKQWQDVSEEPAHWRSTTLYVLSLIFSNWSCGE